MSSNVILSPQQYVSQKSIDKKASGKPLRGHDREGVPPAVSPDSLELGPLPRTALLGAIQAENVKASQSSLDMDAIRQLMAGTAPAKTAAEPATYDSTGTKQGTAQDAINYTV